MATLSSILAWRIPWTEEPGGLQSAKSRTRLKRLSMHACHAVSSYVKYTGAVLTSECGTKKKGEAEDEMVR